MKFVLSSVVTLFLLFACNAGIYSQGLFNKFDVGVQAGTYIYQGDLTPEVAGSLKTPGLGVMVFADRYLNRSFSLRTNLTISKIYGDDSRYALPTWRQQRNFIFNATIAELSQVAVWNILGKNSTAPARYGFAPYLFGGIGVNLLHINRNADKINREWFASEPNVLKGLDEDFAHRLPNVLPVFPVGAGVKYSLTPKLALLAETSYRFTTTDYLDGFSKSAGAMRKDSYASFTIGVSLKLAKSGLDCPVIPK